MSVSEGDILTVDDVAQLLRLRPSTVAEMARRGSLPSFKLGRHVRFHREDIAAHIASMREQSKADNATAQRAHARARKRPYAVI